MLPYRDRDDGRGAEMRKKNGMIGRLVIGCFGLVLVGHALSADAPYPSRPQTELPAISGPLRETATSHAFLSSKHLQSPIDLSKYGYVEEEYLVRGDANVYVLPKEHPEPQAVAAGPYTTRILVRRPKDDRKFNATALVEPLNPSTPVDLPIMWAETYQHIMAEGYAWVGITIKPNTIKALKRFDPARYGTVSMPHPPRGPTCQAGDINPWAQPSTPGDETGLAWDMMSGVARLLKSKAPGNPLTRPAARLYMTGQSQTANYSRAYATYFGQVEKGADGRPLFDGYLYSGSPPFLIPIHQCASNAVQATGAAGVPVIEILTQGDIGTNLGTERPDSDEPPDLFRRYEIAGPPHIDAWEERSFASVEDALKAGGETNPEGVEMAACAPKHVTPTDFPTRYVFDAAWGILDDWVRRGLSAPHAPRLRLKPGGTAADFRPDQSFLVDAYGNVEDGVRTPYVDVPTARWVGAMTAPEGPDAPGIQQTEVVTPSVACMGLGYKEALSESTLRKLYPTHATYVAKVRQSVRDLVRSRWLTRRDGAAIIQQAEQSKIP